jgi:ribonuclease-3
MAGEARRQRIRSLMDLAGARDADVHAFDAAFYHESAVKEKLAPQSNERLEFLGDALLGFCVARSLYERYADAAEGELALRKSSLVSDSALAATADRLGFESLLLLGAGHASESAARRRSALADAFEAFLAVLHRECGLTALELFLYREHIAPREALGTTIDDPKTILQEWMQRHYKTVPIYEDRAEGSDHEPTFHSAVTVEDDTRAEGSGPSKRAAQRAAAANALALLAERYDDVAPKALSLAKDDAGRASSTAAPKKKRVRQRPGLGEAARGKAAKRPHS